MDCNRNKEKYRCDGRHTAECTFYERTLPEDSNLKDEPCVTTAETTEELYDRTSKLKKEIDKSKLSSECVDFDETTETYTDFINKLAERVCQGVKNESGDSGIKLSDIDVTDLDTKCLEDVCGDKITNARQLLQALVDRVCSLYC